MITTKFPFLNNMFGKMERPLPYGPPGYQQPFYYMRQALVQPNYQQQLYTQQLPYYRQQFAPGVRDVGLTDDAVIVTPPHVPVFPLNPVQQPAPAPVPTPEPSPQGYHYNAPQRRLELPHK